MRFRQVHLDFHTSEHMPGVGSRFDKAQFQQALKLGHVDSITLFSKCHHGWAYHPSKANEMHPTLEFDLLGAQIEAAHEIGVKTPVYLSAGLDEKIVLEHPEWLRQADSSWPTSFDRPHYHLLCFNTPYLDYLLDQITEVLENYDADGIFLDIVDVRPCCCASCIKTLRAEGKSYLNPDHVQELAERVYANYTRRVRETVDAVRPGLPVFHNGGHIPQGRRDLAFMNTHLELESLPTGGWGYDHFPLSARYVQGLGMDYLGMTGKFHASWGDFGGFKHPNALRYEVSLAAAHGAKSSIGDQCHPNGQMELATYRLIGEAYGELEAKEPWLDDVTPVTEVALLSLESVSGYYASGREKNTASDTGAVRILLEGKYLFDVVDPESDLQKYKVVILPDQERIFPQLQEKLDAFVAGGGKLLATGKSGLLADKDAFAYDLGAVYGSESPLNPCYFIPDFEMEGLFPGTYALFAPAERIEASGTVLGRRADPYFNRSTERFCSHRHTPYDPDCTAPAMTAGKDGIYIGWQVFSEYADCGALIAKRMVQHALDRLLGESKTLTTDLGAQGVVTLMEQNGRYVNHLLYASPVKRGKNVEVIEDLVPVYDIHVTLRLPKPVKRVYLAPQMEEQPFTQKNGVVSYTLHKLYCHQMVVLEY